MNKTQITKKQAFLKVIKFLLEDKKEINEIKNDVDYYYNSSKINNSIRIDRLINCLKYSLFTINKENEKNINNFIQFIFIKYNVPNDLSFTYKVNFK